jgi:hypothetical protein
MKYLTKKNKRIIKKQNKKQNNKKTKRNCKKGGTLNNNYKLQIIELGKNTIENLHIIYSLPHLNIIDKELNKINNFIEELIDFLYSSNSTVNNEQIYEYIKSTYEKYNLKLYHFNDKKKYSTSSLLFMNILNEEILLMKEMINLNNNASMFLPSKELDTIKNRYNNICDEFITQVPCLEQFVTTIYPRIIKPLEDFLTNIKNTNTNTNINENEIFIKNNVKEKMNGNDFKFDGDFLKYSNPIFELHQNILLSLISFRKSICNHNNNCINNNNSITEAYNENNYKEYLEYIHFFNNEKYKTIGIDWNKLKQIFDSYQIDLPNPNDFINEKMCCLNELKDSQQQIIGGRKKSKKSKK